MRSLRRAGRRAALPPCLVVAFAALAAGQARPQMLIPNQQHRSFTFELHSVDDDVELYIGDPQHLLLMNLRPIQSLPPKIDFTNNAQVVTLRVRDLSLFEPEPLPADFPEDEDAYFEDEKERRPVRQGWSMQIMPAAPGTYVLRCEGGKGVFDFTDLQVREVYLTGDTTALQVEFKRPNPVTLERFKLTANSGSLDLRRFLNARPSVATLQLQGTRCDLDITGKPFAGLVEIFIEGVPHEARITLPRDAGVRVEGPSQTVLRFDRKGLERDGIALVTPDYEQQACRIRLHWAQVLPKLKVRWDD